MDTAVRDTSVGLLFVALTVLADIRKGQSFTLWHSDVTFYNRVPTEANLTSPVEAKSSVDCGRKCGELIHCNSYLFDELTNACWPQRSVFVSPDDTTEKQGVRYFRIFIASCPLQDGYVVHRESKTCFRPVESPLLKWTDARDKCAIDGETLAILEPVEKLEFLVQYFRANPTVFTRTGDPYLVGLSRPLTSWDTPLPSTGPDHVWLNGQPLSMAATGAFWHEDNSRNERSDSNVVALRPATDFLLDDVRPSQSKQRYVCEKPYDE